MVFETKSFVISNVQPKTFWALNTPVCETPGVLLQHGSKITMKLQSWKKNHNYTEES